LKLADIDIDTKTDFDGLEFPDAVRASRVHNNDLLPHPSGYYFENIPVDTVTKLSAIPFNEAGELGYFKVDFLHNSIYDQFSTRAEIKRLINLEPDWDILKSRENIKKLTQIHRQQKIVLMVEPTSIDMLADVLALIRPGKRHLLVPYCRKVIDRSELYTPSTNGAYHFKKAHAVAYAHTIVLQMHLL